MKPNNDLRKTRPMLLTEQRLGESLEAYLGREYTERGRTQRDLATELGVTHGAISRWMRFLDIDSRFPGQRGEAA